MCEVKPLCLMGACQPTVASFIHLTYQEFLAAVSVALNKDNTNLDRLVIEMSSGRFEMVLLFTAGLLGNKDQGHKFLQGIDDSVTTEMSSLRADRLLQSLGRLVLSEDLEKRKTSQTQILVCMAEGRLGAPMKGEHWGDTLDLSQTPQGLQPKHLMAVSYYLGHVNLVKLKYVSESFIYKA